MKQASNLAWTGVIRHWIRDNLALSFQSMVHNVSFVPFFNC